MESVLPIGRKRLILTEKTLYFYILMRAIILAAGIARRLYPLTVETPKCLLEVAGQPIIDYQIKALKEVGINEATVVVGYLSGLIVDHLKKVFGGFDLTFINNPYFSKTNTSYSLHLCEEALRGNDCLLMNGDVLYPVELIRRILNDERENLLAVEVKRCGKEEVKVIEGKNQRLVSIGKELIEENSLGEFIGVAKLSRHFNAYFADSLTSLVQAEGKTDYFEVALHPLLSDLEVYCCDISDLPCIEIDFLEDLEKANIIVNSDWFKDQR